MKLAPIFLISVLAAMSLLGCSNQSSNGTTSSEETTVLRFSHFYPATSDINKEIFEPWAKKNRSGFGRAS